VQYPLRELLPATRGTMTTSQAAELRVKWQQREHPPKCEHLNLELWSDNGYLTNNYNCIVCGEAAAQKVK
jgi:hypothetical protein